MAGDAPEMTLNPQAGKTTSEGASPSASKTKVRDAHAKQQNAKQGTRRTTRVASAFDESQPFKSVYTQNVNHSVGVRNLQQAVGRYDAKAVARMRRRQEHARQKKIQIQQVRDFDRQRNMTMRSQAIHAAINNGLSTDELMMIVGLVAGSFIASGCGLASTRWHTLGEGLARGADQLNSHIRRNMDQGGIAGIPYRAGRKLAEGSPEGAEFRDKVNNFYRNHVAPWMLGTAHGTLAGEPTPVSPETLANMQLSLELSICDMLCDDTRQMTMNEAIGFYQDSMADIRSIGNLGGVDPGLLQIYVDQTTSRLLSGTDGTCLATIAGAYPHLDPASITPESLSTVRMLLTKAKPSIIDSLAPDRNYDDAARLYLQTIIGNADVAQKAGQTVYQDTEGASETPSEDKQAPESGQSENEGPDVGTEPEGASAKPTSDVSVSESETSANKPMSREEQDRSRLVHFMHDFKDVNSFSVLDELVANYRECMSDYSDLTVSMQRIGSDYQGLDPMTFNVNKIDMETGETLAEVSVTGVPISAQSLNHIDSTDPSDALSELQWFIVADIPNENGDGWMSDSLTDDDLRLLEESNVVLMMHSTPEDLFKIMQKRINNPYAEKTHPSRAGTSFSRRRGEGLTHMIGVGQLWRSRELGEAVAMPNDPAFEQFMEKFERADVEAERQRREDALVEQARREVQAEAKRMQSESSGKGQKSSNDENELEVW